MDINLINFLEELETKGLFKSKVGEIDEKFKKFLKNHICCSFVETVKWWINDQMKESPEEMADYFFKVVNPILK